MGKMDWQPVFVGEFDKTISQGRVGIPSNYRKILEHDAERCGAHDKHIVYIRPMGESLLFFPFSEMVALLQRTSAFEINDEEDRQKLLEIGRPYFEHSFGAEKEAGKDGKETRIKLNKEILKQGNFSGPYKLVGGLRFFQLVPATKEESAGKENLPQGGHTS